MANRKDLDNTNPLEGMYDDFIRIINQVVIKYNTLAEAYETFESKSAADEYRAAVEKTDTFFSYSDYSLDDIHEAGMAHSSVLTQKILDGDFATIPYIYRQPLLEVKRAHVLANFEEQNDYYRMLNGYPSIKTDPNFYHYVDKDMAVRVGVERSVPLHEVQDFYNARSAGQGDYMIKTLEGLGYVDLVRINNPQDEYLQFIGSKRIDTITARKAKNFEILYLNQGALKNIEYDEFKRIYEECRSYFVTVIYQPEHRKVIEYYDNFIAMCIMLMAIWHLVMRAMPLGIAREFFRDQGIRMLYEAYNVPYDMGIDDIQQKQISQHLNLLIQWKATNKCLFDIVDLLGFQRLDIYKYYLIKEQKYDIYGVPVTGSKEVFNTDTGEVDTVPDYEKMYNVYFHKVNMKEDNFIEAFNSSANKEDYEYITTEDPFWWEDTKLYKELWESEFNYVETKYISLGISYSMTEMMYECILSLKLLMQFRNELASIKFTLPKIAPDLDLTIFDAVILLCCLTCKKHHLYGDIIAIPTQVTDVLQYMHDIDNLDFCVDAFGFDFDLLKPDNEEGQQVLQAVMDTLNEEDSKKFMGYLSVLSIDGNASNQQKVDAFNAMFKNIRGLSDWISYKLSQTHDRAEYEALKTFYRTAYYARETREVFTINQEHEDRQRTAWDYFEFLHYINPKLYSCLFYENITGQYSDYVASLPEEESPMSYTEYQDAINKGEIRIRYDTLNTSNDELRVSEDMLYYYIDHIIFRLSDYVENIDMLYIRNDTETPLEKLLLRMIRFFKSYTVDLLGLDIILICDFKNENIMRLFDEVHYMNKLIGVDENVNVLLSDAVRAIIVQYRERDMLSFHDLLLLNAYLRLLNRDDNYIFEKDAVETIEKCLEIKDLEVNNLNLYDAAHLVAEIYCTDKKETGLRLRDKVVKVWYSD